MDQESSKIKVVLEFTLSTDKDRVGARKEAQFLINEASRLVSEMVNEGSLNVTGVDASCSFEDV